MAPDIHRTQSSTSLSHHYRRPDELRPESGGDFCTSFWGVNDEGYEVLLARLRGASRTVDEVRAFWRERILIEEDYAKRLAKLSKTVVGKDEIGQLKLSLDTLRSETAVQAEAHHGLTQEMKKNVEQPVAEFAQKIATMKKISQTSLEKAYKLKLSQESYVSKARERYAQDCLRINSYAAQTSLSQGRELDRVASKLEKAQGSIGANERDFSNFVKALSQTTEKWEAEWRVFCDQLQDLEEERIEFVKDVVWTYANGVSSVCVTDDEACERLRVALENVEPATDLDMFIRDYGTGSQIPDPPRYVNYSAGESDPTSQTFRTATFARSSSRPALPPPQQRPPPEDESLATLATDEKDDSPPPPPPRDRDIPAQHQSSSATEPLAIQDRNQPQSITNSSPVSPSTTNGSRTPAAFVSSPHVNSAQPPPPSAQRSNDFSNMPPPPPPQLGQQQYSSSYRQPEASTHRPGSTAPPSSFPASSSLEGGSSASSRGGFASSTGLPSSSTSSIEDPIAKALADLQAKRMNRGTGSFRSANKAQAGAIPSNMASPAPSSGHPSLPQVSSPLQQYPLQSPYPQQQQQQQQRPGSSASQRPGSSASHHSQNPSASVASPQAGAGFAPGHRQTPSLIPPMAGSTAAGLARSQADFDRRSQDHRRSVDYSTMAESVVGAHPASRPSSPAPSGRAPSPAFMQPPTNVPTSPVPVEAVLNRYSQSFPGEAKDRADISRRSSNASRVSRNSMTAPTTHEPMLRSPSPGPREGFVGIGSGGGSPSQSFSPGGPGWRAPSPAPDAGNWQQQPQGVPPRQPSPNPHQQIARQASPAPPHLSSHQPSHQIPPRQPSPAPPPVHSQQPYRQPSPVPPQGYHQPNPSQMPARQPSPAPSSKGSIGLALNADGSIAGDPMGGGMPYGNARPQHLGSQQPSHYSQHQQSPSQQPSTPVSSRPRAPSTIQPPLAQQPPPQQQQRYTNYVPPSPAHAPATPQHTPYGYPQHPPYAQNPPPSSSAGPASYYGQAQQPSYGSYPSLPPSQSQGQPQSYAAAPPVHQQTAAYSQPPYQQPPPPIRQPSPAPVQRAPSPAPPPQQVTEEGKPVIFYVKALYDYQATIDEEFDFQTDDIIAVTAIPDDGWWSGELLDESRRLPGKNVFPSNFVTMLS